MESLFEEYHPNHPEDGGYKPLAERVRPQSIDEVAGQHHLLGKGAPLRVFVERGEIPSMILWGPPGTGKTTLAHVLCTTIGAHFERMSAVESGVKELREVLKKAESLRKHGRRAVLFIDEIHRFTKSQQDALLHAVERGVVTLIGATTENPSFEVNNALLSRCQVYVLRSLSAEDLKHVVLRAIDTVKRENGVNLEVDEWDALLRVAAGDARKVLNVIETITMFDEQGADGSIHITSDAIQAAVQQSIARYDRNGDLHYDTVSAFIKSLRGSDPDAALLYCAVMIDAGEDPLFIARRMVVFASEDIGNADPQALQLAVSAFNALERIGMPEGRIILGQTVTYLASAPKSNASYTAIDAALNVVRSGTTFTIPMHIRNAPTQLMKNEGYGAGYQYPHQFPGHVVDQQYLPDELSGVVFYNPTEQGDEKKQREHLHALRPERYR